MEAYIGIPFISGGRKKDEGLDCYGLLMVVYKELFGVELEDKQGYCLRDRHSINSLIENHKTEWLPVEEYVPGDVVYFRIMGVPMHLGIVVDKHRFIHCIERVGVCQERLDSMVWQRRLVGFYRHERR